MRPDIVFSRKRVAVFVDGCFWHACPEHGTSPAHNASYWSEKLKKNVARDVRVTAALMSSGWDVVRIWEHTSVEDALATIVDAIRRV